MTGTVLVTGAGGFIGRAVAARLAQQGGWTVRAGLRTLSASRKRDVADDSIRCDLDDSASLDPALRGVAVVVHAAFGSVGRMAEQLAALLAAADRAGTDRIVLFSSVAVYGSREGVVSEDAEPSGPVEPYGAAKRACERLLRDWAGRPGSSGQPRAAVILRPGIVYGYGSRLWIERPLASLRAGWLACLGLRGAGTAGLVHIDDVAEATRLAVAALTQEGGSGFADLALNLTGPEQPSWDVYLAKLADRAGLGPLRTIGPAELAAIRALSLGAKVLARLRLPAPPGLAQFPAAGELALFARRATYDSRTAQERLGWCPAVRLDQGLALSLPAEASR